MFYIYGVSVVYVLHSCPMLKLFDGLNAISYVHVWRSMTHCETVSPMLPPGE